MNSGDKIKWAYKHYTNSTTVFTRTKYGVFVRMVKDKKTSPFKRNSGYAIVQFSGNKTQSKVPFNQLQKIKNEQ